MNQKVEVTSKRFWLNSKDFLKGLLLAVVTSGLVVLEGALSSGPINWLMVGKAGLAGGVAYLLKNYFQPAQIKQNITAEQVDAMKDSTEKASK